MVKYKIVLHCWYQEIPNEEQEEHYNSLEFDFLEDACQYLGNNYEKILDIYPVVKIEIKPI